MWSFGLMNKLVGVQFLLDRPTFAAATGSAEPAPPAPCPSPAQSTAAAASTRPPPVCPGRDSKPCGEALHGSKPKLQSTFSAAHRCWLRRCPDDPAPEP